eukprot:7703786-Lingulodinium_polyedra.AAC.1
MVSATVYSGPLVVGNQSSQPQVSPGVSRDSVSCTPAGCLTLLLPGMGCTASWAARASGRM